MGRPLRVGGRRAALDVELVLRADVEKGADRVDVEARLALEVFEEAALVGVEPLGRLVGHRHDKALAAVGLRVEHGLVESLLLVP